MLIVLPKDMATRIIAGWYLTGQEKNYPAVNFNTPTIDSGPLNLHVDVQGDHYKSANFFIRV
jgi:beta-glucosidase